MKLAIVCSWLNQYGGAERVLEVVHDMYPQAPIYTSIYRPRALPEHYRSWDIRPSFLNRLPLIRRFHQVYLPFYPLAFESLDLRGYDVVFSLTSAFGHGVITPAETRHVCYCLTPARFLWNYHSYIEREGLGRLARLGLAPFLKSLRQWDRQAADRVDEFIAISRTVQRRIAKYYRREAQIIYPPVDTARFAIEREPEEYFLVVSRLVPYKRIDLAVRAFNELGLPLRIIGEGRDRAALQAIAAVVLEVVHDHFFGHAINGHNLVLRAHVEVEFASQPLRCGDQQGLALGDGPADIIGQAAIGEGDVFAALKDDDLGLFIQAAQPRRGRRPAGHAPDDDVSGHWNPSHSIWQAFLGTHSETQSLG
jgi:glycosyltransferase involved in cell wall biosynthesis